jgi:hypothetical protein
LLVKLPGKWIAGFILLFIVRYTIFLTLHKEYLPIRMLKITHPLIPSLQASWEGKSRSRLGGRMGRVRLAVENNLLKMAYHLEYNIFLICDRHHILI